MEYIEIGKCALLTTPFGDEKAKWYACLVNSMTNFIVGIKSLPLLSAKMHIISIKYKFGIF